LIALIAAAEKLWPHNSSVILLGVEIEDRFAGRARAGPSSDLVGTIKECTWIRR
jgi:hypothetical protein